MQADYDRRSKLAFGFAVICVFFIIETVNADARMPNKASPYIWALLGLGAAACAAYGFYCRRVSRRPLAESPDSPTPPSTQ